MKGAREFVFRLNPLRYADGRYILNRFKPLCDDEGKVRGLEGVNTDLSAILDERKIYESLFKHELVGNAVLNNEGKVLFCNESFKQVTAYEERQLQNQFLDKLTVEKSRSELRKMLQICKASKKVRSFKLHLKKGDNHEEITVIANLTLVPEKEFFGFSITEITELERERALFKSFFRMPDYGKAIVKKGFQMVSCNRKYEEITGYTEDELKELTVKDFLVPADRKIALYNHLSRFKHDGKSEESYIMQAYHKKGHILILRVHAELIEGSELVFSSIEDITQEATKKKKLIDTLSEHNSFRDALNQSSLVSITDIKGKIIFANEKFREVSKLVASEKNDCLMKLNKKNTIC